MGKITFSNRSQVIVCGLAGDTAGSVNVCTLLVLWGDHQWDRSYCSIPPMLTGQKATVDMPKAQGKKSTAHAWFIWHMDLRTKCSGERFTAGRHRGFLAQTGLKADCHSSARRLQGPSAVCPFCQAAHALKPIPVLKGELETSYPPSWFQAFFLCASTCAEQKAAKDSN